MKRIFIAALVLIVALLGCTRKPAPVATDTQPVDPSERLAIAVEYVAVPSASVYARPALDAEVVGSYGFSEAISILEKKPEWCLVRTFDGSGWIRQTDLATGNQVDKVDTTTPRFYVEPKQIPFRTRGEIWMQAKVNTDGAVVEVKTIKNTTGSMALANANADALMQASFYPMVDKGTRKTFIYEHRVYY
jgi:hypothetical protein